MREKRLINFMPKQFMKSFLGTTSGNLPCSAKPNRRQPQLFCIKVDSVLLA